MPDKTTTSLKKASSRKRREMYEMYLTREELLRFFSVVDDPYWRLCFMLMYHFGLRVSEVVRLKKEWYQDGKLWIERSKGSVSKSYPLDRNPIISALLANHAYNGPFFFSFDGINPMSTSTVQKKFAYEYAVTAGLPENKRNSHVFRHSAAVHALSLGIPAEKVQDLLGHKDIKNTMIYAKILDQSRNDYMEKLVSLLPGYQGDCPLSREERLEQEVKELKGMVGRLLKLMEEK